MSEPTRATVKRLFAMSGNRCAFPKCSNPLVEPESGKVTGRVCHIRARQSGGPRYDGTLTDAELHAFDNLILLCPIHHDVIDADEEAYTVARLERMKHEHQLASSPTKTVDDAVVDQLLVAVRDSTIGGSVIISQGQVGGQIAHSIVNVGAQARTLNHPQTDRIREALAPARGTPIVFSAQFGNDEAIRFADQLEQTARDAGMLVQEGVLSAFTGPTSGVQFQFDPRDVIARDAATACSAALSRMGFLSRCDPGPNRGIIVVIVGSNNTAVSW